MASSWLLLHGFFFLASSSSSWLPHGFFFFLASSSSSFFSFQEETWEEDALAIFKRVLLLNPDDADAQAAAKRARAIISGRASGNELFKAGNMAEALAGYLRILALKPCAQTSAKLHFNIALCYLRLGDKTQATDRCTAALTADATHVKARIKRSELFEEAGLLQQALEDLDQLPDHAKGTVHQEANEEEEEKKKKRKRKKGKF